MRMKVYLAGPEVFMADALDMAERKKAICAAHGLEGVFPVDAHPDPAAASAEARFLRIYLRNEAHIRDSAGLIANLTPYRGPSADAGTVFELGFARALGKRIFGYANTVQDFAGRTLAFLGPEARRRQDGAWEDAEGMALEDFGLHDNLMIDGALHAADGALVRRALPPGADRWRDLAGFEACVRAAAAALLPGQGR
jgi:nucleoside 2-deoxyribosyltransferase